MSASVTVRRLRGSAGTLRRFVFRRSLRGGLLWAVIFGVYVLASAGGFASAYPTLQSREQLAVTFGNNVGLKVLVGQAHQLSTVAGFTSWRALGILSLVGSIWGLLLATKWFRGEETAGRTELFLVGRTSARAAAMRIFMAFLSCLLVMFAITAALITVIGRSPKVGFSAGDSMFFAVSLLAAPVVFLAIGALTSQLFATRGRAAGLAAALFGVFFVMRGMADAASSVSWLRNLTPLGWIENLHPLTDPKPLWLIPLGVFALILAGLSIWLAGKRDLGESIFRDRDTAKPRLTLLKTPLLAAIRLTRSINLAWLVAIIIVATGFSTMAKSAGTAFSDSPAAQKYISKITDAAAQSAGIKAFLGIVFLMIMTLVMLYVAGALGSIRNDEAEGYLDNLLVRPVGRLQWLFGRVAIVMGVVVLLCMITAAGSWAGAASQHASLAFSTMLLAGLNAIAPAVLVLGFGILCFGFIPRATSVAVYVVVAWSFLLQMIGSLINLNHWILDTAVFRHIALAPTTDPNWRIVGTFCAIGVVCAVSGAWRFKRRDLETA
jgi:ABC-2 type transport system permease protein